MARPESLNALLEEVRAGSHQARERLFEVIYPALRRIADRLMRGDGPDHTLQPIAPGERGNPPPPRRRHVGRGPQSRVSPRRRGVRVFARRLLITLAGGWHASAAGEKTGCPLRRSARRSMSTGLT